MTNKIRSRLLIFMTAAMVLFTSGCSAALENQPQQGMKCYNKVVTEVANKI